jgi:hypothetical protein
LPSAKNQSLLDPLKLIIENGWIPNENKFRMSENLHNPFLTFLNEQILNFILMLTLILCFLILYFVKCLLLKCKNLRIKKSRLEFHFSEFFLDDGITGVK